jgi:hypothetical protein
MSRYGLPLHVTVTSVVTYDACTDYFDPRDCDYNEHMKRGGQRVFTVFVYLNKVDGGGTTS